jgi:hypothetical protein
MTHTGAVGSYMGILLTFLGSLVAMGIGTLLFVVWRRGRIR